MARVALSIAAIASAIATMAVNYALPGRRRLFYVLKPLTTSLILSLAAVGGMPARSTYAGAIVLGLVFCLAGDILLMLPQDRFIAGLVSFLLANLIYGSAFATSSTTAASPWVALPIAVIGAVMLAYLWPGLSKSMRGPVSVYVVVMVAMASLAVYRASGNLAAGTLSAAVGALLYLCSDAALAISRFRHPFRLAQAVVLSTYFAGQLLIALSTAR